jgi:hypothetical protein
VQKLKRKSKNQASRGKRAFAQTAFTPFQKQRKSNSLRRAARLNAIPARVAEDKAF